MVEMGGTARTHWPSLSIALLIMLVGIFYPPLMANGVGKADHMLAMTLFWAMSSGFVRGLGFIPYTLVWRLLFSGWSCAFAVGLALAWVWIR